MTIWNVPVYIATNTSGSRISGAKIYTYLDGTTTPSAVYTTDELTTAHANPVVADANGIFPAIYLDSDVNYRFRATDGSDAGDDPDQETELWQTAVDDIKTGLSLSYDFTVGASGAVGTSQEYLGPMAVRAFTLADDFAGSNARLETGPTTSEITFSVTVNDTTVGSIVFATGSQSGVLSTTGGAITINDNDYIDIIAPASPDSAAGLRVTFKGTVSV